MVSSFLPVLMSCFNLNTTPFTPHPVTDLPHTAIFQKVLFSMMTDEVDNFVQQHHQRDQVGFLLQCLYGICVFNTRNTGDIMWDRDSCLHTTNCIEFTRT